MQLKDLMLGFALVSGALAAPSNSKRDDGKFDEGQPISADGKGGPILGKWFINSHGSSAAN
jgi:hypothetical protein